MHTDGVGKFPLLADAVNLIAEFGLFQNEIQDQPDCQRNKDRRCAAVLAVEFGKAGGLLDELSVRIGIARSKVALGQKACDLRGNAVEHNGCNNLVHAQLGLQQAGNQRVDRAEGGANQQAQRDMQRRGNALDHIARKSRGEGTQEYLTLNAHIVHIRTDGKCRSHARDDDRRSIAERVQQAADGEKRFFDDIAVKSKGITAADQGEDAANAEGKQQRHQHVSSRCEKI